MAEEENTNHESSKSSENITETKSEEENTNAGLEALSVLREEQTVEVPREPIIDKHGRSYATGKRKKCNSKGMDQAWAGKDHSKWTGCRNLLC